MCSPSSLEAHTVESLQGLTSSAARVEDGKKGNQLSTYDLGVLGIPSEEFELEENLFGQSLRSASARGRSARKGGIPLPGVTREAAQLARDAVQNCYWLSEGDPMQKWRALHNLGMLDEMQTHIQAPAITDTQVRQLDFEMEDGEEEALLAKVKAGHERSDAREANNPRANSPQLTFVDAAVQDDEKISPLASAAHRSIASTAARVGSASSPLYKDASPAELAVHHSMDDSMSVFLTFRHTRSKKALTAPMHSNSIEQPADTLAGSLERRESTISKRIQQISTATSSARPREKLCCMVGGRLLQNLTLRQALKNEQNLALIERDEPGVDIMLDTTTACLSIKAAVLPAIVNGTLSLTAQRMAGGTTDDDDAGPLTLRSLCQSGRYDRVIIFVELFTASGFTFDATPPVVKAIQEAQGFVSRSASAAPVGIRTAANVSEEGQLIRQAVLDAQKSMPHLAEIVQAPEHAQASFLAPIVNPLAAASIFQHYSDLHRLLDTTDAERSQKLGGCLGSACVALVNSEIARQRAMARELQVST